MFTERSATLIFTDEIACHSDYPDCTRKDLVRHFYEEIESYGYDTMCDTDSDSAFQNVVNGYMHYAAHRHGYDRRSISDNDFFTNSDRGMINIGSRGEV